MRALKFLILLFRVESKIERANRWTSQQLTPDQARDQIGEHELIHDQMMSDDSRPRGRVYRSLRPKLYKGPRPDQAGPRPNECQFNANVPIPAYCDCYDDRKLCAPGDTCVVIIIQLGCDILTEIEHIAESVKDVVLKIQAAGIVPGSLKLGMIRYGIKRNIHIDLTLLDRLNAFTDVITDVIIKNLDAIEPMKNAHFIPAFSKTFDMFEDYNNKAPAMYGSTHHCQKKMIFYVTNGHLQCEECVCIPDIATPFLSEQDRIQFRSVKTFNKADMPSEWQTKFNQIKSWAGEANSFVSQICSDYLTEETGECCLGGENKNPHCRFRRGCTSRDIISCSSDPAQLETFLVIVLAPKRCEWMNPRICLVRNKVISMYRLLELQCAHQDTKILVQTPNQVPCNYARHITEDRRVWTDNRFEDCYNADLVAHLTQWQSVTHSTCQLIVQTKMQQSVFVSAQGKVAACSGYDSSSKPACVTDEPSRSFIAKCIIDRTKDNEIVDKSKCLRNCTCEGEIEIKNCDFRNPQICNIRPECCPKSGCCGPRGPAGGPGNPGQMGLKGPDGPPGPCGDPGECGQPGRPGGKGGPGDEGVPGRNGPKGPAGRDGNPGRPGGKGRDGKPGGTGIQGPSGRQGSPGEPGGPGPVGGPGNPGGSGNRGAKGPCGEPGQPGTGIESQEYYDIYRKKLKERVLQLMSQYENSNNPSDIRNDAVIGGLYRTILLQLTTEIKTTCKCNCNAPVVQGVCQAERHVYSEPPSRPLPQCGMQGDDPSVVAPDIVEPEFEAFASDDQVAENATFSDDFEENLTEGEDAESRRGVSRRRKRKRQNDSFG